MKIKYRCQLCEDNGVMSVLMHNKRDITQPAKEFSEDLLHCTLEFPSLFCLLSLVLLYFHLLSYVKPYILQIP